MVMSKWSLIMRNFDMSLAKKFVWEDRLRENKIKFDRKLVIVLVFTVK